MGVSRDGGLSGRVDEEFVHLFNASNLVRGSIDREHEDEDDSKENRSVSTIDFVSIKQ